MASRDEAGEDAVKFTECGFCGVSSEGNGDGDFDFDSAFAMSSGSSKVKTTTSQSATQITLRKCNRCKSVAYCSRACQQNDYRNHKGACRTMGQDPVKNAQAPVEKNTSITDDTIAGLLAAGGKLLGAGGDARRFPRMEPPPKKGLPAPSSHPRTSISNPIDEAIMNEPVVLHCDSERSPVCDFTGVYIPYRRGRSSMCYVYDRGMTHDLLHINLTPLEYRGYFFDFPCLGRGMLSKSPNHSLVLQTESGERFNELQIPRSRSKLFWNDPDSVLYMNPSDVYSSWSWHENTSGERFAQMAITPLQTLRRAAAIAPSKISIPLKYQKAQDFSVWNRSFVLHVDPRTCQLPLPWVDTLMGTYTPIEGKLLNGYPIWERQCSTFTMPDAVKKSLEKHGIRSDHVGRNQHLIYVHKRSDKYSPSLLTLTEPGNVRSILRKQVLMEASHVPSRMSGLLTEPASLFTSPDEAFSTWAVRFEGKWMEIHVAFTPKEFFQQAITLATLDAEVGVESKDGSTPAKKKRPKKNKRKKKPIKPDPIPPIPAHVREKEYGSKANMNNSNQVIHTNDASKLGPQPGNLKNEHTQTDKKKTTRKKRGPKPAKNAEGQAKSVVSDEAGQCVNETNLANSTGTGRSAESADQLANTDVVSKTELKGPCILRHLALLVEVDPSNIPPVSITGDEAGNFESWNVDETCQALLEGRELLWLGFKDTVTAPLLAAAASTDTCRWLKANASELVMLFSKNRRQSDLTALLGTGVSVSATSVATLLSSLPRGRGDQFNNKIAKIICASCEITIDSSEEFRLVMKAASHTVGKGTKRELTESMKKSLTDLQKPKKQNIRDKKEKLPETQHETPTIKYKEKVQENEEVDRDTSEKKIIKEATEKIEAALSWYNSLLDERMVKPFSIKDEYKHSAEHDTDYSCTELVSKIPIKTTLVEKPALTPEEVADALSNCDSEDALANVETGIDLFKWEASSEWTIDITEQAHKWFRRHIKKDRALCERIIRRLTLLSTGRWPYVLCKQLKSKKIGNSGKKINLYETKINAGSRIIWEVALAFSPRRSRLDQSYCEQVIRVWDIILDHDNLNRAIDQAIERIENSHLRGEDCAIYAEIDKSNLKSIPTGNETEGAKIPRVFRMSNEVTCTGSTKYQPQAGRSRHFHPASEDPRQFTLLKFYELNAAAVKILLEGKDAASMDLPFTPGPKEHEIIHYQSNPQRSILLMGRSGTGKTTCLVFRMWAQHASCIDGQKSQLRQLFMTKNDVLCREVKRSFNNMGLAWTRRKCGGPSSSKDDNTQLGTTSEDKVTKFVTSNVWLEALDVELPGDRFFTPEELEERINARKEKDTVTKGVEALLLEETHTEIEKSAFRQEMTYPAFKKLWRKIRSGSGSQLDSVLVWREIKSFIKGSVPALHINEDERSLPQNRFLSLDEYLSLPRKQSRMDEIHRREVYDLYVRYETLKREGGFYDECDLVYNIAGRISSACFAQDFGNEGLLPIDSLFVDEVQDYTQAELYILAKLCRDPNNLFLAGDTAQSISVGVDFRFTDLRQIFYNNFGGVEPKLLQLSHNYRSHAGVLRLAACVVELLYFFFSNSLDRLPPDLGLFSGPKPVIMEVTSTADLILMLDGAKRETSRIEFGAHQVILVRSEDAKKNLPDEFEVDRDWVMTVQQSKGLEFDDVLLYNFFSDSPAGDTWRVVSNYTKEDIKNYYSGISVASSGVQKYDWDDAVLSTRHLDFTIEKHKILETELKMLYTAITRARVNVFIAETDIEAARPMFSYFQRRAVVDVASKDNSNLSGVRVFGAMNNVEDWRSRGEYYLQNAEGERQKGCLSLAAKCFDKSGEVKRRDFALAYLAFIEIEEQDYSKKRGKHAVEWREKLYNITEQLLEARDVGFLNKAALCLLRTGQHNGDAARMFELYARLCHAEQIHDNEVTPPSLHEKKYLSYAAKLFAKCISHNDKGVRAIDSFRCYVCAGMYDDAAGLIGSGMLPLRDGETFKQLRQLCLTLDESKRDIIASFQIEFQESTESTLVLKRVINKAAKVGCRILSSSSAGFSAALGLLSLRSDRTELLSSIDESTDLILSKKPWASNPIFNQRIKSNNCEPSGDGITKMLISELKLEERHEEVVGILEDRGLLLEAAELLGQTNENKSMVLRTKYVELMLLSKGWEEVKKSLVLILERNCMSAENVVDVDTRYSCLCSSALLTNNLSQLLFLVSESNGSIMWQHRALRLAFEHNSRECLLAELPGSTVIERLTFVHELAKKLICLASALRKPNTRALEDNLLIAQVERYFELVPKKMDRTLLETKPLVNCRLREVSHSQQRDLPFASTGAHFGFTQSISREKMHNMLSNFICDQAAFLLMEYDKLAGAFVQQKRNIKKPMSIADTCEYIHSLQLHLLCRKEMTELHVSEANRRLLQPRKSLSKTMDMKLIVSQLRDILLNERRVSLVIEDGETMQSSANTVVIQRSVIDTIYTSSMRHLSKSQMKDKKCDIMHTVTLWRLRSLYKNTKFANRELNADIVQLEKHHSTRNDYKQKRRQYFINKKNQIFPRLWLWVVESSQIMNSISVTERIIQTSLKDGLTPMSKLDQISLLEVNAVALFSSLSLRYSEVELPPILIPKYSYLQGLLTGDTGCPQLQGFGNPLKNVLSTYCHKHFDKVFSDVVAHLEESAALILSSELLASVGEGKDDGLRFERAFCLSIFLCCNSVVFSTTGEDMNVHGYQNELSVLPSLPLQGNVKKLVARLRHLFTQKEVTSLPDGSLPKLPGTFLDLATFFNERLKSSSGDHFVLCWLKQTAEEVVHVLCVEDISQVHQPLASIPFDTSYNVFENSTDKSIAFLEKSQPAFEEGDHGRKSDELNAVRLIARLAKANTRSESKMDAAILHFRRWKVAMRIFIRLLNNWTSTKTAALTVPHDHGKLDLGTTDRHVFEQMPNQFQDNQAFHQQRERLKANFYNAVVDGIECSYCGISFDPPVLYCRSIEWDREGRTIPFPMFAQYFNKTRFGTERVDHPGLMIHVHSPIHQDNVILYRDKLNTFATVMARIAIGLQLLSKMVHTCDEIGRSDNSDSLWYLNTGEESRGLKSQLEQAQIELSNAGIVWSRQPSQRYLWTVLHDASRLPQHAEMFFLEKRDEEIRIKQSRMENEDFIEITDAGDMIGNPIEELMRGPYLNPEAPAFMPQVGSSE